MRYGESDLLHGLKLHPSFPRPRVKFDSILNAFMYSLDDSILDVDVAVHDLVLVDDLSIFDEQSVLRALK